jgi:hypothetical protein
MDDAFNYVAVLVSIVVGLGVTRVLSQLSEALQADDRRRTYWVHTLWMISFLILLLLFWWVFYRWHNARDWTFFLFLWVNVAPILLYLGSGVLCPGELESTGSATWRELLLRESAQFVFHFRASLAVGYCRHAPQGQTALPRRRAALSPNRDGVVRGCDHRRHNKKRTLSRFLGHLLPALPDPLHDGRASEARLKENDL